jgi:hypothetical protein
MGSVINARLTRNATGAADATSKLSVGDLYVMLLHPARPGDRVRSHSALTVDLVGGTHGYCYNLAVLQGRRLDREPRGTECGCWS